MFAAEMLPGTVELDYQVRRVTPDKTAKLKIREQYQALIAKTQDADLALYEHVKNIIISEKQRLLRQELGKTISRMSGPLPMGRSIDPRSYVDFLYRKLYMNPAIKIIRRANGLPFGGVRLYVDFCDSSHGYHCDSGHRFHCVRYRRHSCHGCETLGI